MKHSEIIWTTKAGVKLTLEQMDTSHLFNTLSWLDKQENYLLTIVDKGQFKLLWSVPQIKDGYSFEKWKELIKLELIIRRNRSLFGHKTAKAARSKA